MDGTRHIFDFAVIGAGIAGASIGAELARHASVMLLEMESQPGYHTTGRSAATFAPGYGPQPIRALTRASAGFFNAPPHGFSETPLLTPRDVIMIARSDQLPALDEFVAELSRELPVERLNGGEMQSRHCLLRHGYAQAGALDTSGSGIDVHALHHGYLATFKASGGLLRNSAEVKRISRETGYWRIETATGTIRAATIINAAGAWADQIGQLAGAESIGLVPKRRTAMTIDAPEGVNVDTLPLIVDIDEEFYMKPDAGRLLISPANEDPMPPCDVQPEELDIAICVDRIEKAFDIEVGNIANKWAGLRSFVADKSPVIGFSQQTEGFFWLAGQGGYGIQTSPALSRLAAAVALGNRIPKDILDEGLDPSSLLPQRISEAV